MADIAHGTPPQRLFPTVMDTGSLPFWVTDVGGVINDGNPNIGVQGQCNYSVPDGYNYKASSTSSDYLPLNQTGAYSYGGNHHFVLTEAWVNDTISFGSTGAPEIPNAQVALSNISIYNENDPGCTASAADFDQSIMGLGPFGKGIPYLQSPPSFRTNLRYQNQIEHQILSMWSQAPPESLEDRLEGVALFGQPLPEGSYIGKKLYLPYDPPGQNNYIGYYIQAPNVSVSTPDGTAHPLNITSPGVQQCLVDSGTVGDSLFVSSTDFGKVPSLFIFDNGTYYVPSYNGTCDSMPSSLTLDYTFNATATESVTVKVPLKNYARSGFQYAENTCGLNIEFDFSQCVLSAQFFTGAALEFDDDQGRVGVAQGAVATSDVCTA